MGTYNGFTGPERRKGGYVQTWAYKNGYLIRPHNCSACNVRGTVPGQIIAHLEDYTEPIKGAIFLCGRCHKMVHIRERYPQPWEDYRDSVRYGWQWPLIRGPWEVYEDHVNGLRVPALRNSRKSSTVLDEIHDGIHHPGPRSVWADKMAKIMAGERVYWYPEKQDSLF